MATNLLGQLRYYLYDFHINIAKQTSKNMVTFKTQKVEDSRTAFLFNALDKGRNYTIRIIMRNSNIDAFECNCDTFRTIHSCIHIPLVIMKYEDILTKPNPEMQKEVMKNFLTSFVSNSDKKIKKRVNIEYYLYPMYYYNHNEGATLKLKIGFDKLYMVNQKFNRLRDSYYYDIGPIEFGKNFTYDNATCYFDEKDSKILEYIFDNFHQDYDSIRLTNKELNNFLKYLSNSEFYINDQKYNGIKNEFPLKLNLKKDKDNFILDFGINNNLTSLTENNEFIIYDNNVYRLNAKEQNLINKIDDYNLRELQFTKEDINTFNKGLLPIIKDNINIDENITEIKKITKPDVKLYFDLNEEDITCDIKLLYNSDEINYFDDAPIFRDEDYENKIVADLEKYNFQKTNKEFVLIELEDIVNFIESGLEELTNDYEVFTSEKLKNTNIKRNSKVSKNFSIGKDTILRYEFKLDNLSDDELFNVINSYREKKKYYKLKNGDIMALENSEIEGLNNLMNDLDISNTSNGEIPKYQAIFLDYLKKEKYPGIITNNLFDNFVNKFLKYHNNNVQFTSDEKKILRNYQVDGVEWLVNLHKCDLGGILADEMGLGKSIQTIYMFKKILEEDENSKFLIVCPTALVYNWANEFIKFGPQINVSLIVGNKNERYKKIKNIKNVAITTYGILREDISFYEDLSFKVCVIDEAQNIKNPFALLTKAVKNIKADTKIALTGTPLENSLVELWSIFDFIMPGFLNNLTSFNRKYNIKNVEIDNEQTSKDKPITNLKKIISPFILRRKKSDVAKDLPDKIENNIYIDLSEEQKKVYAAEVKNIKEELEKVKNFNKDKFKIINLLTKLRQICIDPRLIYNNFTGESTKMTNLLSVLKELIQNGHKILIFSSFKKAFDIVRNLLEENNITYYQIDGSVNGKIRQDLVNKFNSDQTNVFLITLKSGGTGINLTSADVVIHLDLWWNPQAENQATDRTHRIGQTKKVEIIKLIASGTIEERILELQNKKRKLADKLIEKNADVDMTLSQLTEQDIKDLIDYNESVNN